MADAIYYDYRRYREAKSSVDDRSTSQHVVEKLRTQISRSPSLRVLEIGGGTDAMVRRTLDQGPFKSVHYTLVDRDADALQAWSQPVRSTHDTPRRSPPRE